MKKSMTTIPKIIIAATIHHDTYWHKALTLVPMAFDSQKRRAVTKSTRGKRILLIQSWEAWIILRASTCTDSFYAYKNSVSSCIQYTYWIIAVALRMHSSQPMLLQLQLLVDLHHARALLLFLRSLPSPACLSHTLSSIQPVLYGHWGPVMQLIRWLLLQLLSIAIGSCTQ